MSESKNRPRLPDWLRVRIPASGQTDSTKEILQDLGLHTVCQSARCPNIGECFAQHTATFLIMGNTCTRNCRFCAVEGGVPLALEQDEPQRVGEAVRRLGLKHVVVTSVTRDDLPHGGAEHFAATIVAVRSAQPGVVVEILTPDFQGASSALEVIAEANPDIFNHNIETVPRLYPTVRPEADYTRSLRVLAELKQLAPNVYTKSGVMVGLGEEPMEVLQVAQDLRDCGVDILTIGQYLRPSIEHLPVEEFVHPDQFTAYREQTLTMGFRHVASAPLVRSSFHADEFSV